MAASPLSDRIMGMATLSNRETFPLPSIETQKACKSALKAVLIGHAKWEPVRLLEPTQCGTEGGIPCH